MFVGSCLVRGGSEEAIHEGCGDRRENGHCGVGCDSCEVERRAECCRGWVDWREGLYSKGKGCNKWDRRPCGSKDWMGRGKSRGSGLKNETDRVKRQIIYLEANGTRHVRVSEIGRVAGT